MRFELVNCDVITSLTGQQGSVEENPREGARVALAREEGNSNRSSSPYDARSAGLLEEVRSRRKDAAKTRRKTSTNAEKNGRRIKRG